MKILAGISRTRLVFLFVTIVLVHLGSGYPTEYATNNVTYVAVGKTQKKSYSPLTVLDQKGFEYTGASHDFQPGEEIPHTDVDELNLEDQPWKNHRRVIRATQAEVEDSIKQIIAEQLGEDKSEVAPEKDLVNDLGADSLAKVECVMALEEKFDLQIPEEDCKKLETVQDFFNYIESRGSS